ncbi:cystathionine gamma-synthase [Alginatibacterium sediminis]|uniref:Cystathionine gamma-synthase n=1 Tax=Alginatibacterium sediminis TaxID=2164068 RepID=A0A420E5Y2_9ALTE|nr:cystathionine gamma-synthase [Alginatibacterium sediminis]RKF13116.1 cystathionine gamma-synthase [Alginatibacterium sediminis]
MSRPLQAATLAVRTGIESDPAQGAVVPPIYLSTNYAFKGFDQKRDFDYSRSGNPTRSVLAEAMTKLEGGCDSVITNTGMSAVNLVTALLNPGDLLIAPHDCYGGSYRLFDSLAKKGAFEVVFIDQSNESELQKALERNPRLVWLETPSNPLLRIVDVQKICSMAKSVGALIAVDNTFLSPALQQPLLLGADIVVHSATKYLNGHSDVVAGVVVSKDPELAEKLSWWANCLGLTGGAFDSYLILRGLRTLNVRMRTHQENALQLAHYLTDNPWVSHVYYPGLESDPGHQLAKKQQAGFGGMLSFELAMDLDQMKLLLASLELFSLAESLGGVESLVCHPATMTHAAMSEEALENAGVSQRLIRLSVGLEDGHDLVADLAQAFARIA